MTKILIHDKNIVIYLRKSKEVIGLAKSIAKAFNIELIIPEGIKDTRASIKDPLCNELKLDHMYEAMDILAAHAQELERHVFFKTAHLSPLYTLL